MKKILSALIVLCSIFCLASCSKEDSSFTFSPSAVTISVGETASSYVTIVYGDGGSGQCGFSSDNEDVASIVSASGNIVTVVGKGVGTATITGFLEAEPSLKGTLKVTVTE